MAKQKTIDQMTLPELETYLEQRRQAELTEQGSELFAVLDKMGETLPNGKILELVQQWVKQGIQGRVEWATEWYKTQTAKGGQVKRSALADAFNKKFGHRRYGHLMKENTGIFKENNGILELVSRE